MKTNVTKLTLKQETLKNLTECPKHAPKGMPQATVGTFCANHCLETNCRCCIG